MSETRQVTMRGRVGKRRDIMRAAGEVFAEAGYTGAAMEAISARAGVSTRTLYNHFTGKEQLFTAVIEESATHVAETLEQLVQRHLGDVTEAARVEQALVELGLEWARPQASGHLALVRHIHAEAGHVPPALLQAWDQAGPVRAVRCLARAIDALARRGLLRIDDAEQAAEHFLLLTVGAVSSHSYQGAIPLDDTRQTQLTRSGVRAFLHGHLPR